MGATMPKRERVYEVWSTYKVTGIANIVATSAAEAARIGREGYADGYRPDFDFSEPHSETRMRAERAPEGAFASTARDMMTGAPRYPVPNQENGDQP